jgi:hypothetical protein
MDINEIKKLIDAFYNGETNREEEQTLRDYFNGNDVANELQDEKELFLRMYESDALKAPSSLEQKLSKTIDLLSRQEKTRSEATVKKLWIQAISVAASLAILVSIGLFSSKEKERANNHETVVAQMSEEDKQKVREAEEALLLLSSTFNKGIEQITLVSANLDKATTIINNSINR